jgi:cytochrome c oxidase subunit II
MGKFFAVVLVVIVLVSAYFFAAHTWWLPADISTHGPALDRQFDETLIGAGIGFLVSQIALAIFVWKSSSPNAKLKIFPGGAKGLVIFAILLVGVEIITLESVGQKVWAALYFKPADPNSMVIQVQAEQFAFYFRYPGPDGKFGAIHPEKIDEGTENFFGLDPANDVAARDDIVVASMYIPVNRPIELLLHSKDLSHSFYVRELRIQQDFVPGMDIPLHFTATQTGKFEIVCTQLCGLGHYNMKAYLNVLSQNDFDQWLKSQSQ